ncbi:MAG TPA: alkene reductase [Cycloclasticus sp.]|jgi:N-ethylmaleimide reductase|nr:alkene reductase [Cycloclasticus sp.]HIL92314.1 alkene reductase [Cycloclasticus sp.]
MTDLFSSIKVGPYTLSNRIFMAPMTRNRAPDTIPNELMKTYYTQRASSGLIISEGAQISPQAIGYPGTPGIHTEEQIAGWKTITDAIHEQGGHIFCQLWHVGRSSHPDLQPNNELPVAPSAIKPAGEVITFDGSKPFVEPRALSIDEIKETVTDYAHAAECALQAGFDGVEIHAANGYLIDQFLRNGTNQRDDNYGGSIENRTRFLLEVVDAVNAVWGASRVAVRLSPLQPFNDMKDSSPEPLFTHVVKELNQYGLAYLHVTEMGAEVPGVAGPAFDLKNLRPLFDGVYVTNAGYDKQRGNVAIAKNSCDAVAFGVPFIANPDLAQRLELDADLNEADPSSFYGGDSAGYTDYPSLG